MTDQTEILARLFLEDPPVDYLAAIGLVSARYSRAEMSLISVIRRLSGLGVAECHALTAHMMTPTRLNAFLALARLQFENDMPIIHDAELIAADFEGIARERANVIHPLWAAHRESGFVARSIVTARQELKQSFEQHPIEEVRLLADKIETICHRFLRFQFAALGWDGPLPSGITQERHAELVRIAKTSVAEQYDAFLATQKIPAQNKARKRAHAAASRRHPSNAAKKK